MGTYQPAVYRKQGGNTLVVASSGALTIESGSSVTVATALEIASGGRINLDSGSSMTVASGAGLTLDSGSSCKVAAPVEMQTGGYVAEYVQTAATTATTILPYGLTLVTGTTAGPTFLISNPIVGVKKYIALVGASSGATLRAIISPATTTVVFDGIPYGTTGYGVLTLNTSLIRDVALIGCTTLMYRCVGSHTYGAAMSQVTT